MEKTIENMSLDGGCLCFNFVNTVYSRKENPVYDYLRSYEDVVRFAKHTEIMSAQQRQKLLDNATKHPQKKENAFSKIKTVRKELFFLFHKIAENKKPTLEMMDRFNELFPIALSHLYIKTSSQKMELKWKEGDDILLLPLWMVIKSAYDVLLNESPKRIKTCPGCLWLFMDKTKNNGRRWCNSLECGSRDKALRYYYRKQKSK